MGQNNFISPTYIGSVKLSDSSGELYVNDAPIGGGGSSGDPGTYVDFGKNILSEDIIEVNNDGSYDNTVNFTAFMNNTFSDDIEYWQYIIMESYDRDKKIELRLPKDYRFTVIYNDKTSVTVSFSMAQDYDFYPANGSAFWNYGYTSISLEAIAEHAASITFDLPNGSKLIEDVFIYTDAETGDSTVIFGSAVYDQGTSSHPTTDVNKIVIWMPSCNTHYNSTPIIIDGFNAAASITFWKDLKQIADENFTGTFYKEYKICGMSYGAAIGELHYNPYGDPDPLNTELLAQRMVTDKTVSICYDIKYSIASSETSFTTFFAEPSINFEADPETGDTGLVFDISNIDYDDIIFGTIYLYANVPAE